MTLRWKMFLVFLVMAGLGIASHEVVYRLRPKPASMQERGLAWLREEYHIPEEGFRKIEALHRDYFEQCDLMCAEMVTSARPSGLRGLRAYQKDYVRERRHHKEREASMQQQKALCERCMNTMVNHLESVAALMPPEEGRRFLKEIMPELTHPQELEQLAPAAASPP
jgi:hypothetical protein